MEGAASASPWCPEGSPCLGAQRCSPDGEGAFLAQQDLHARLGLGAARGAFLLFWP